MSRTTSKIARSLVPAVAGGRSRRTERERLSGPALTGRPDAAPGAQAHGYRDLRSPDARDPGRVEPTPSPSADSTGTDWSDVRIVAAGAAGLLLIGLGGVVLYTRRTRTPRKSRTPVASR
jgi:hypothetical protein